MEIAYDSIPRDIANQPIFVPVKKGGEKGYFFRNNGGVKGVGPWMSKDDFWRISAILYQKPKKIPDESLVAPEKVRDIDWLRGQHPVSRKFLTAIDAARFDTLKKCGVQYLPKGWLRIRRWIKENGLIDNKPLHVTDLDAAIRMQVHILGKYREKDGGSTGEFEQLLGFEEIIREANRLLISWKLADAEEKKKIVHSLVYVVSQMEKCRNDFKVAARDQLVDVLPLADRTGKPNPGALAARTMAALYDLAKRFQELRIIMPIIALRHELLVYEKNWFDVQAKRTSEMMVYLLPRLYKNMFAEKESINLALGRILYFTGFFWPSPFYERAKVADGHILVAKYAVRMNDGSEAIKNLIFAHHLINGGLPPKNP